MWIHNMAAYFRAFHTDFMECAEDGCGEPHEKS